MMEFFAVIILLVVAFFIFVIMRSDLDAGGKAIMSLVAAVVGVIGGSIAVALIMIQPLLGIFAFAFIGAIAYGVFQGLFGDKIKNSKAAKASVKYQSDPNATAESVLQTLSGIQTGQEIRFGPYDWLVLDVQDDEALIYTKNAVLCDAFHHDPNAMGSIWANCTLRSRLNRKLLKRNFTPAEQSLILEKEIPNTSWDFVKSRYKSKPEAPTRDRLFPLSVAEFRKYVPKREWRCTLNGELCDYYLRDTNWSRAYRVRCKFQTNGPVIDRQESCIDEGIRIAAWVRIR